MKTSKEKIVMKNINTEKLVAELTKMQFTLNAAYRKPQSDNIVRAISLEYDDIFSLIESLQQEQESIAEQFAKIVRANLSEIGNKAQSQFEQLYFKITGTKMYGGYND